MGTLHLTLVITHFIILLGPPPVISQTSNGCSQCTCGVLNPTNRIVGGTEADINEYPYQVGLIVKNITTVKCGGSLISDRWVLTAAHCFQGGRKSDYKILLKGHSNNPVVQDKLVPVTSIRRHHGFEWENLHNDIALVKIEPLELGTDITVNPVCLPTYDQNLEGQNVTITGWGLVKINQSLTSPSTLQEVSVAVVPNAECEETYSEKKSVIDKQLCTFTEDKDSCFDDSGSPIVKIENGQATQIALVSYGWKTCEDKPAVNIKIASYLDWIYYKTGGLFTCPR